MSNRPKIPNLKTCQEGAARDSENPYRVRFSLTIVDKDGNTNDVWSNRPMLVADALRSIHTIADPFTAEGLKAREVKP